MAERSAIASGFSLSDIGTEGGCWRKVVAGGGRTCFCDSEGSSGARRAAAVVGVRGDTGGLSGDCDLERSPLRSSDCAAVSMGEAERVFVGDGMVKAGILRREQRTSRGARSVHLSAHSHTQNRGTVGRRRPDN